MLILRRWDLPLYFSLRWLASINFLAMLVLLSAIDLSTLPRTMSSLVPLLFGGVGISASTLIIIAVTTKQFLSLSLWVFRFRFLDANNAFFTRLNAILRRLSEREGIEWPLDTVNAWVRAMIMLNNNSWLATDTLSGHPALWEMVTHRHVSTLG